MRIHMKGGGFDADSHEPFIVRSVLLILKAERACRSAVFSVAVYSTLKELRFQGVSLHSKAISLKASISAAENNRPPA
jgi:hypothetical protein